MCIFALKMDIENFLSTIEHQLRSMGFSDETGALLLQLKINGQCYIKACGNLNNLTGVPDSTVTNDETINFVDFMRSEIPCANIGKNTMKIHYNTANVLEEYNPALDIRDINSQLLEALELYMHTRGMAINTIARHMKTIKRYINVARKKEIIFKYPFLDYTIKAEETHRESLGEKELELLENYREQLTEPNEVLNAFLFSCYTGLRYSDICSFTKQCIHRNNHKQWAILKMQKTNSEIRIPISTAFEGRALKLSKEINRSRGLLFHLSSYQNTNRTLKRIMKQVGIKKNITFHCARHTFATLLIYRGVSITTIQKLLGHKSVKTTQVYSAVTDLTIEKELMRSKSKIKKKQSVLGKK